MAIWAIFAAMTGAAVLAVLWPLSRHRVASAASEAETGFYKDQIAEIERDRSRGLIDPAEAEAAKAEAGRRLLRSAASSGLSGHAVGEPALRRRRAATAIAFSMVPLVAIATYGAVGSPELPAFPLAGRVTADPAGTDVAVLVNRVETHLAQNPEDGRGWDVLVPIYLDLGRFEEAARASANALKLLGPAPGRLETRGEALVAERGGIVSADAKTAFEDALRLDPSRPKPRFYLAQAAEQDGDRGLARRHLAQLVADAPSDAPWLPQVRQRLAAIPAEIPGGSATTGAASDQATAIRGMVDGLQQRLDADGGSLDEWSRLVRSYTVLGEREKAIATLDKARRVLGFGQHAALDATARELGLPPGGEGR